MSVQVGALHDSRMLHFENTPYWQAYGLQEDPFAMENDPRMYYASPHWEEYIDLLQYLCQYNNDLLVIAGVSGSGKTMLINEFIAQVDNTMRTCYTSADNKFTSDKLLNILADGFDLSDSDEETILDEIQDSDKICVLTIDNAHTIPAETLRTLLRLVQGQSEKKARLHMILLGEPQVQMALLRIADADGYERDQIHNLALEPFSLEETHDYLAHRLTVAGLNEDFPLSDETVKRIYKLSEGIPGRINRIVRRTLINEMPQPEEENPESWISVHRYKLLGGVLLAAAIVGVGGLLNWANQEDSLVTKKQDMPSIAFDSTATPIATQDATAPIPAPVAEQMALATTTAPAPQQATSVTDTPAAEPTPSTFATASADTAPAPQQTAPVTADTPAAAAMATEPTTPTFAQPEATPAPVKAEKIVVDETPQKASTDAPVATRPLSADEKRLMDVAPSRYTLQLVGLSKSSTARQFIAQNNLTGKVSYYRSTLNGKPLIVLVYGNYASIQEAKNAVPGLPDVVQRLKPWPRSMKIVQDTIQQEAIKKAPKNKRAATT